jgi:hypothetical protein
MKVTIARVLYLAQVVVTEGSVFPRRTVMKYALLIYNAPLITSGSRRPADDVGSARVAHRPETGGARADGRRAEGAGFITGQRIVVDGGRSPGS